MNSGDHPKAFQSRVEYHEGDDYQTNNSYSIFTPENLHFTGDFNGSAPSVGALNNQHIAPSTTKTSLVLQDLTYHTDTTMRREVRDEETRKRKLAEMPSTQFARFPDEEASMPASGSPPIFQSIPVASPSRVHSDSDRAAYTSSPEEEDSNRSKKRKVSSAATAKKNAKWMAMLDELKEYKEKHGDCIVPRGYPYNTRLASWVAEQRKQYKLMQDKKPSNITQDRVDLLNDLGFTWNAQEAAWNRHFEDLKKYKEQYGDCLVPMNFNAYPQLGLWVKEQRRHYMLIKQGKHSHMTFERIRSLESIGFCWDSHEATWWDRFRELEAYKNKYGDCMVPTKFDENPQLGTWVHHQRRQYKMLMHEGKQSRMNERRITALNAVGFAWAPRGADNSSVRSESPSLDDDALAPDELPSSLSVETELARAPLESPRFSSRNMTAAPTITNYKPDKESELQARPSQTKAFKSEDTSKSDVRAGQRYYGISDPDVGRSTHPTAPTDPFATEEELNSFRPDTSFLVALEGMRRTVAASDFNYHPIPVTMNHAANPLHPNVCHTPAA